LDFSLVVYGATDMQRLRLGYLVVAISLFMAAASSWARAQSEAVKKPNGKRETISALIDRLQEIKEGGDGYSPTTSSTGFLPRDTHEPGAMLLMQAPPVESDVLRELVRRGPEALPQLLAHLDDKRPTKFVVEHPGGFGGMEFYNEYDFNSRTRTDVPKGVNRDFLDPKATDAEASDEPVETDGAASKHKITVGDLCYFALGQIVNREFSAVRYQPTLIIVVNSPTHSPALLKVIRQEWGGFDAKKLQASLVRDFTEPDVEERRDGACLRLGYYFPEMLEPLVLKQLAQPRIDDSEVNTLVQDSLYKAADGAARKKVFDAFIAKHGEVGHAAMLAILLSDLGDLEQKEEELEVSSDKPAPPKKPFHPRECLIELFQLPAKVKSADCRRPTYLTDDSLAKFIDTLIWRPSAKIDQAIRSLLATTDDLGLAESCIDYLIGRGADQEIPKFVARYSQAKLNEQFKRRLDRLTNCIGWTALHAAAESGNVARAEAALAGGADINRRAANGQTALHVAAASYQTGVLDFLLKNKADPNIKDNAGNTPLQVKSIYYDYVVKALLDAGAEPTDVFSATIAGRDELATQFMNAKGFNANAKSSSEQTALHYAAAYNRAKIARRLLDHGATVDVMDDQQYTPLHVAAYKGHKEMVVVLLKAGAKVNALGHNFETPIDFATQQKHAEIIELLKAAGANTRSAKLKK
jgi:ankyrin repeat protein